MLGKYVYLLAFAATLIGSHFLCRYILTTNKNIISFWQHDCDGMNCIEMYFVGPPSPLDNDLMVLIREKYLIPPPKEPDRTKLNIYTPVWKEFLDWTSTQEALIDVFADQPPGFFVEVGALNGEFMSQTLFLEKNLDWSGLLIEPNPRSFAELQKKNRNAWLSPLCVTQHSPSSKNFWIRKIDESLPDHIKQVLISTSKLASETLQGDELRGFTVSVPCTPLTSILKALNVTKVDFLSVSVGGENDDSKIKDVTDGRFSHVKFVLIFYTLPRIHRERFPSIKGYIRDLKRSQKLMKLYVKESDCMLISIDISCDGIHTIDANTNLCGVYFCFKYLRVVSDVADDSDRE